MITLYVFDTQKCIAHKTHFPCNQTTLFVMNVSDSLKKEPLQSHLFSSQTTLAVHMFLTD